VLTLSWKQFFVVLWPRFMRSIFVASPQIFVLLRPRFMGGIFLWRAFVCTMRAGPGAHGRARGAARVVPQVTLSCVSSVSLSHHRLACSFVAPCLTAQWTIVGMEPLETSLFS